MTTAELLYTLKSLRACDAIMEWARATPGEPAALWQACERGDWLLWLAGRAGVSRISLVLATCDCARLALLYAGSAEPAARNAIEIAEAWTRGEATLAEVSAVAHAAADAAADVSVAASATAAATAAAASAAASVTNTIFAAAAIVAVAAAAAEATFAATTKRSTLRRCADLVRARIPWDQVEAALKEEAR